MKKFNSFYNITPQMKLKVTKNTCGIISKLYPLVTLYLSGIALQIMAAVATASDQTSAKTVQPFMIIPLTDSQ